MDPFVRTVQENKCVVSAGPSRDIECESTFSGGRIMVEGAIGLVLLIILVIVLLRVI